MVSIEYIEGDKLLSTRLRPSIETQRPFDGSVKRPSKNTERPNNETQQSNTERDTRNGHNK